MSHSVYFVGAGLSKALQREKPIPLLADFVRTAAHYAENDESDIILLELLGLERLNRFRWESEICRKLAKLIEKDERKPEQVRAFLEALRRRPSESVENFLARDTGGDDDRIIYHPPVRFRYAISRLFSMIGWDVELNLLREFVHQRLREAPGRHSFVCFNYDLFLDRVVAQVVPGWHWHCGYGFDVPYSIASDPAKPYPTSVPACAHSCRSDVQVLKPHGSLNWLLPVVRPAGAMPFGNGPVVVRVDAAGVPEYVATTTDWARLLYPAEAAPIEVAPCIIPPLRRKDTQLEAFSQTREAEVAAVRDAREAFVLGWSMPQTDDDQRCLIRCATQLRAEPLQRLVVVNLNQPPEYFERVADTFGVPFSAVEAWNDGIIDYIRANPSASPVLQPPAREAGGG